MTWIHANNQNEHTQKIKQEIAKQDPLLEQIHIFQKPTERDYKSPCSLIASKNYPITSNPLDQNIDIAGTAGRNLANILYNNGRNGVDGLEDFITPDQTISLKTDLTNDILEELLSKIKPTLRKSTIIIHAQMQPLSNYDTIRKFAQEHKIIAAQSTECHRSTIYAISINEEEGLTIALESPQIYHPQIVPGNTGPFQYMYTPVLANTSHYGINMYSKINFKMQNPQAAAKIINGIEFP